METWNAADWTLADWFACFFFLGAAIPGVYLWIRFRRLPELRKARFLFDESASVRWGLVDVLIIGFIWLASQALALQVLAAVHGIEPGQKLTGDQAARFGVVIGIVQLVVIGFSLVYLTGRYQHDESEFGFGKGQFWPGLKAGLITFVMWIPVVWAVQTVLVSFIEYSHPSFERIHDSNQLRTIVDTWITAVVIAPVVEEILFRGIIQGWLQRVRKTAKANPNALILGGTVESPGGTEKRSKKKSGRPLHLPAIVITSVLFGLAHFSQGPAPISLFVLSLGIGYLYQRTGSLVACIFVHALLNGITMLLFSVELSTIQ